MPDRTRIIAQLTNLAVASHEEPGLPFGALAAIAHLRENRDTEALMALRGSPDRMVAGMAIELDYVLAQSRKRSENGERPEKSASIGKGRG